MTEFQPCREIVQTKTNINDDIKGNMLLTTIEKSDYKNPLEFMAEFTRIIEKFARKLFTSNVL